MYSRTVPATAAAPLSFDHLLATWPFIHRVLGTIDAVASTRATVLITGESGTGKELVARMIHFRGNRRTGPFRAINCAALPEHLFESELFGHEKGAFTGAIRQKPGLFELAHGGTLLLDEISEMPASLQAKLLRVLQEREVQRVGSLLPSPVDVHVIATTNRDLPREIGSGRFRKDLFYRLNVVPIHLPPLRERMEDIPSLARHFIEEACRETGRTPVSICPEAMRLLQRYGWPGNVRELENVIARAVIVSDDDVVTVEDLPPELVHGEAPYPTPTVRSGRTIEEVVRELILVTLDAEGHNQTRTAHRLGISTRTLRNKLHEYGVKAHHDSTCLDKGDDSPIEVEVDPQAA
ncbi:MAG TPA: sigma-54 dependent transcriptional regulator [bacterium]|nr:sigma-54 dependent transcriptional regulator [bacterium]